MTTTRIRQERLEDLLEEGLAEIVERHWHEVRVHAAEMPLAVDWGRYFELEEQGVLVLFGARRDGVLVGYASFLVMPHLHYSTTVHALNDAIYVDPAVRGLGVRLIRESERLLAARHPGRWVRVVYHVKVHVEKERGTLAPVFERLGYGGFETCYDKMVRV